MFISGELEDHILPEVLNLEQDACLIKPVKREKLLETVSGCLNKVNNNRRQEPWKEALKYKYSKTVQKNLKNAEYYLNQQLEEEREKKRQKREAEIKEKLYKSQLTESKIKINNIIKNLSTDLNANLDFDGKNSGGMDFIAPSESKFSKGTKTSAPVDLTHLDFDKPVNPAFFKKQKTKPIESPKSSEMNLIIMKQQLMKQGMIIKETTSHNYKPLKKQATDQIVVSALNYGKGNLQDSISYLENKVSGRKYSLIDTNQDYNVQLALSYLEGMRMGAVFKGDKYENSDDWFLFEMFNNNYSNDKGFNSIEELEASGKELTTEMFESGELKFMNPKTDWKNR